MAVNHLTRSTVIAFGAPIFPSEAVARRHLRRLGPMERLMADRSPWARRLCGFLCDHRALARNLAPLLAPALPPPVAADGVDHSWASYSGTFESLMTVSDVPVMVEGLRDRLLLVYGREDRTSSVSAALRALGPDAPILVVPGDHHLPLRRPELCRNMIAELSA